MTAGKKYQWTPQQEGILLPLARNKISLTFIMGEIAKAEGGFQLEGQLPYPGRNTCGRARGRLAVAPGGDLLRCRGKRPVAFERAYLGENTYGDGWRIPMTLGGNYQGRRRENTWYGRENTYVPRGIILVAPEENTSRKILVLLDREYLWR